MIRLAGFAFAKHLHFAKDAKRQWDVGQWDRDGHDETHSCPPVLRRPSVCGAGAPRHQCGGAVMEIVPSQLFCVVSLSLFLQSRIRMGDVFLQSEGHQDRELS